MSAKEAGKDRSTDTTGSPLKTQSSGGGLSVYAILSRLLHGLPINLCSYEPGTLVSGQVTTAEVDTVQRDHSSQQSEAARGNSGADLIFQQDQFSHALHYGIFFF